MVLRTMDTRSLHVLSGVNVSELKAFQPVKVVHIAWIHLQVQCVR